MTEDGFRRLKTFHMESGMSIEDLARILSSGLLNTASILNTFSSEKMISPVSVPDVILFRRTFARANLFFLEVYVVVVSLQFDGGELQIGFNDIPYRLLTHIYFANHFPH